MTSFAPPSRKLRFCVAARNRHARGGLDDLLAHDQLELLLAQPALVVAQLSVSGDAEEVGVGHVQLGLERLWPTNVSLFGCLCSTSMLFQRFRGRTALILSWVCELL